MGVMDWILLLLIALYTGFVIFSKKKNNCCGNCSQCSSCKNCSEKTPL